MRVPLAGPGLRFVLGGVLAALPALLLPFPWACAWGTAALGFAAFSAFFFRDPERALPADPSKVWSPGDGTVLTVGREGPGDIVTVRIFLAVWNVHVQRAPIGGTAEKITYTPGGFAMAMRPEARRNERNSVTFADGDFRVTVEQIAGFIARRIECWIAPGAALRAGERYGMIRYGSQAAVHMPGTVQVLVRPGDRVAGAVTPLAER